MYTPSKTLFWMQDTIILIQDQNAHEYYDSEDMSFEERLSIFAWLAK